MYMHVLLLDWVTEGAKKQAAQVLLRRAGFSKCPLSLFLLHWLLDRVSVEWEWNFTAY